jgi:hypothetical protein
MTVEILPTSVSRAEVVVAGVTLVVHHLDNGQRIIERDGMLALFEAMNATPLSPTDADIIAKALRG